MVDHPVDLSGNSDQLYRSQHTWDHVGKSGSERFHCGVLGSYKRELWIDPEYFYEFGLSSIVDYPIYLVWNFIQLLCLYFFFLIIHKSFRNSFIVILVSTILIFSYEFIPVKKNIFNYESIAAFVLLCLILTVTIKFFNNVYLFVVLLFSIIWLSLLSFGTSSSLLVNLFFAARYAEWEGFFAFDKNISGFVIPASYLLILISLLILSLIRKRNTA